MQGHAVARSCRPSADHFPQHGNELTCPLLARHAHFEMRFGILTVILLLNMVLPGRIGLQQRRLHATQLMLKFLFRDSDCTAQTAISPYVQGCIPGRVGANAAETSSEGPEFLSLV